MLQGSRSDAIIAAWSFVEQRCAGCGYGVSTREVPQNCPMCRQSSWETPRRRESVIGTPVGRSAHAGAVTGNGAPC